MRSLHERATGKAMVRLLPVLGLAYFMAYVDRVNVALAKTALAADVGVGAAAYGLGAGLFFVSYALLEVPSNLVLYRVGPRWWITRIAVSWGAVCAAMMFVSNAESFYVLRLLLGATEAGLFPAMMYMTTRWFSQKHRVTTVGLIYVAPCAATVIGSPMGGALMELDGRAGLHGWQWMFLVEGLATVLVGILVWFLLPGSPGEAKWLTPEESAALTEHAVGHDEPVAPPMRDVLRLAFARPIVLVLAAIYFVNQAIASGVGFNFPAVLQSFGFTSTFVVGLVAGSVGISGLAGVLFWPWMRRRYARDVLLIGICATATLLIMIGFLVSTDKVWSISLIFVSSFFGLGTLPLFWSVAMSRMSGLVAATGLAFINTVGITGGFVGPYVYGLIEDSTGSLRTPYYTIVGAACVGVALVPLLARAVRRDAVTPDGAPVGQRSTTSTAGATGR